MVAIFISVSLGNKNFLVEMDILADVVNDLDYSLSVSTFAARQGRLLLDSHKISVLQLERKMRTGKK